ncbi:hypothetical protein ACFLU4_09535, partial [Chloroflexota bacterium]
VKRLAVEVINEEEDRVTPADEVSEVSELEIELPVIEDSAEVQAEAEEVAEAEAEEEEVAEVKEEEVAEAEDSTQVEVKEEDV